ncbi:MAG: FeoB-associated Cys-rich membrane protein [Desulfurivibrionaceae bacterium]
MWQNIILLFIIAACIFFIGRRLFRQLTGRQSGCSCSCKGCNSISKSNMI